MDVKLKVLGGAKSGLEIALKKDKFTIGRSSECSLRAGSDAISRRHCIIRIDESAISIEDLKSRNGTFINGRRIDTKTVLSSGDEVRVGPLKFQLISDRAVDASKEPRERRAVKVEARATGTEPQSANMEDSIDQWLTLPTSDSVALHETTSVRLDDTQGGQVPTPDDETIDRDVVEAPEEIADAPVQTESDDVASEDEDVDEGSGIKSRKDKRSPGKLPPRPKGPQTKDSREAAAEVLRAMTRRR